MGNCLIWISLCMFFFPLIETVTYTCHYMTDRLERFDLKTSKLDLLKKKRHLHLGCPWGKLMTFDIYIYQTLLAKATYSAFRLYMFYQYVCSLRIEPTTFCAANAMLYHWATGTQEHSRYQILISKWTIPLTNVIFSTAGEIESLHKFLTYIFFLLNIDAFRNTSCYGSKMGCEYGLFSSTLKRSCYVHLPAAPSSAPHSHSRQL